MKWKLDRGSYYPLIATALNKSERARTRERGREKRWDGEVREKEEKVRERMRSKGRESKRWTTASGHFLISDTGRPKIGCEEPAVPD